MGFWWEKAVWPAVKGVERAYPFFEDIRRLLFLIEHPSAGSINIYRQYGKKVGEDYVPYDENNWVGSWDGWTSENPAKPGWIKIFYKDATEAEDIYVNFVNMTETNLDAHPPIKENGMLDTVYWKLAVNPNFYCHYNSNAGKPKIGADGRYIVIHHSEVDEECELSAYTSILKAYKWLPRHTHPYRQVAPLDLESVIKQRRDPLLFGVETKDKYITQSIGTEWNRSKDTVGSEPCKKPRRLSEYVLESGEPDDPSSGCEASGQCAEDPKMNEAYQDRAIFTIEQYGSLFMKEVDANFITAWEEDNEPYDPINNENHPVYAYLSDKYWHCNVSAYELVLREIDDFDWWWDTSHPAVPWWLYDEQFPPTADWPLPRGCWRRTWKYSMGRVGALKMMWPQEGGNPPGHSESKFIVTRAVYDAIPEGNQGYYTVSDVEGLYDAAYGSEEEALIAERHDPKVIIEEEPCYEIHPDLVNDLWYALLELTLLDWPGVKRGWLYRGVGAGGGPHYDSSLEAYSAARSQAIAAQEWVLISDWGVEFNYTLDYLASVRGHDGEPPYYTMYGAQPTINDLFAMAIRLPVADILPGALSGRMLIRVKWQDKYLVGWQYPESGILGQGTNCEFGFEDKTLTATPVYDSEEVSYRWEYVVLEAGAIVTSDDNYYYFWYYGYILSPWPLTGEGEHMDFVWEGVGINQRYAQSNMYLILATTTDHSTIFDVNLHLRWW